MRILGFVNNRLGLQVVEWLRQQNENIVGLVVHPEGRQKYASEILSVLDLPADRVFNGAQLNQTGVKDLYRRTQTGDRSVGNVRLYFEAGTARNLSPGGDKPAYLLPAFQSRGLSQCLEHYRWHPPRG